MHIYNNLHSQLHVNSEHFIILPIRLLAMSDAPVEETELDQLICDQGDIIVPQPTENSVPVDRYENSTSTEVPEGPPANGQPIESDEIFSPSENGKYTIKSVPLVPLRPAIPCSKSKPWPADETDNEEREEPQYSYENPFQTDDVEEASQCPDDPKLVDCCCLTKSSYLERTRKELFFAVNYHQEDTVRRILSEAEPDALVQLLTRRDTDGLPCLMKAITRLSCIQILFDSIQNFDHNDKLMALQSVDGKNIFHFAAQLISNHVLIKIIETSCPIKEELVNKPDIRGTTPLIVASQYDNHAMACALVRWKAEIDHVDDDGYSPMYWATASGSAEILKLFLTEGKKATGHLELYRNSKLYKGEGTILRAIVESSSPKSEKIKTCLEVEGGKEHIIHCLKLELKRSKSFIHKVCETPLVELVKLAYKETGETDMVFRRTDEQGNTPLIRAIEAQQFGVVQLILSTSSGRRTLTEKKMDTKETALMIACKRGFERGFPEIVQFMMENSDTDMLVKLDRGDRNAFHHAAKNDVILSLMIDVSKRTEKYKRYKNYLITEDINGYTPLHYAAVAGSHKSVELLLENGVSYNIRSTSNGRTALHYAACSNILTVKTLVEFVKKNESEAAALKDYVDAVDARLQTALHVAASFGKWQTIKFLLANGATIKCDQENQTALHYASYAGSKRCVESLLEKDGTIVNDENLVGETPAMFAALNNQKETLELLLDRNAELFARSHGHRIEKIKTCLDWAVLNRQPATVKFILGYKDGQKWREAMEKSWVGPDGLLARMVITMPEVAIEFLDECVKKDGDKIEYDFFALQTKKEEKPGVKNDQERVTSMQALENMAKCSRNECLNHVVVQKFLEQKWSLRARKWYFSCFVVYIIFLLSLTAYIILVTEGRSIGSDGACAIIGIICYIFVILSVVKEFFQLIHQKFQYFCVVSTYFELIMYVCVFIFLPYDEKSNVQRQAGAIAIFFGWLNFAWFLKLFSTFGIYIIMAKKIFITFLKVFLPVSFFLIAFSMAFFVLFNKQDDGFGNCIKSFITSFAMMVGEVDYRDAFLVHRGKNFELILIFLVLSLILMSILLMNLLTGLAVGDTGVIMRRSLAEKQIQQALLIVDMDKHLNKYRCFGATYVKPLVEGRKPDTCAARCMRKLRNAMIPGLDIEEEKEACENAKLQRQLDRMQNTLSELKRSLQETQTSTSVRKNGEFLRPRRNTAM